MAVINIFANANGISFFHPRSINWSYLNLGIVQRTHMNKNKKNTIFANNAAKPITATMFPPQLAAKVVSFTNGMSYPPKNKVETTALEMNMLIYSAKR